MGTNYYANFNVCKTCNKPDERVHIGKSSFGWPFCFRMYRNDWELPTIFPKQRIDDTDDWREVLSHQDIKIVDEYGRHEEVETFWHDVDVKQKHMDDPRCNITCENVDKYGYRFHNSEFS